MKITTIISLMIFTIFLSCNSNNNEIGNRNVTNESTKIEKDQFSNNTENYILSIPDSIKKSVSYFFSNSQSKDLFLLTIQPDQINNSKSSLQIITTDNKVLYTQTFDTYYFIKWIYDPDSIPTTVGQDEYEKYLENYKKSITPKKYETYFKSCVDRFFNLIEFVDKRRLEELKVFGDINDNNFLNEFLTDSTIKLISVPCFDCDEGSEIIGYSKIQNKVVTLLEYD